ncbi:hypothetical protein B0T16DRAFT_499414 [Cercophora newfieldiana]|uniref:Uncharacterized protein n=1 Tax=Cercophora newfieldiana TaxID=92897 RepID=A0AA40CXT1_9PEZI|nr:hypothetical protein B0T16DRAFT_499414 [Cercophora newfieldiana]
MDIVPYPIYIYILYPQRCHTPRRGGGPDDRTTIRFGAEGRLPHPSTPYAPLGDPLGGPQRRPGASAQQPDYGHHIRRPGDRDPHTFKGWRPICRQSVIGKGLERLPSRRNYGYGGACEPPDPAGHSWCCALAVRH